MNKLLVILGPTSTGKTDLALSLASGWNGELVSCDSRQVYRGLDIGTGKAPRDGKWEVRRGRGYWEIGGIKIWMYDVVNPNKQYTVADYVKDADRVIKDIQKRNKLPIIVGGTGLYLKALLYGLSNLTIPVDQKLRRKLEKLSLGQLQEKLKRLFSPKWKSLNNSDRQNPRRLVRAIELAIGQGDWSNQGDRIQELAGNFDVLKIGLSAPRDILYKNVDKRVVDRINQGMVKEAQKLYKNGLSLKRMRQLGLEYGVLADYLEQRISRYELIKIMQGKIHNYVRRQLTWFKKEKDVYWFDISKKNFAAKVENLTRQWYHS